MKPIGEEKGCEYCLEMRKMPICMTDGMNVFVTGGVLRIGVVYSVMDDIDVSYARVPIRYCPMCGRKLTYEDGRKGDES